MWYKQRADQRLLHPVQTSKAASFVKALAINSYPVFNAIYPVKINPPFAVV